MLVFLFMFSVSAYANTVLYLSNSDATWNDILYSNSTLSSVDPVSGLPNGILPSSFTSGGVDYYNVTGEVVTTGGLISSDIFSGDVTLGVNKLWGVLLFDVFNVDRLISYSVSITDQDGWGASNYGYASWGDWSIGLVSDTPIVSFEENLPGNSARVDGLNNLGTLTFFMIGPNPPDLSAYTGVPEPMSMALVATTAGLLLAMRRKVAFGK